MNSPCSNLSIVALSFVLPLVNPFLQWVAAKAKMIPEKSSVCGLFLAFFKLPTRDKIFSSKFHTTFPSLLRQQKQEKKKPTTKNKTKKKSHKTPKHSSTTEPPPFPSCSHLLPPNYKTQNLILILPNNNNNNNNKDTN